MRDFIHIDDCVEAITHTVDAIEDADALNLSTGLYTSFIELARMAAGTCGYVPDVIGQSDKPMGVFARGGDTAKQRRFGIVPRISLDEGIRGSCAYFEDKLARS